MQRAQVSLPIVRQFVASVEAAALGVTVVKGVRPDQQLVKVVNDELVRLMGGQQEDLVDPKDGPQVRLVHLVLQMYCFMLCIKFPMSPRSGAAHFLCQT